MSLEDLPSAQQSSDSQSKDSQDKESQGHDSRGEGVAAAVVPPVVAVYGSALHQLNLLDSPEVVEPGHAELSHPAVQTDGSEERAGEPPEESAGSAGENAPLQELNELCGLASSPQETGEAARNLREPDLREGAEPVDAEEPDTAFEENELLLVQLGRPPSFDRVMWNNLDTPVARERGFASVGEQGGIATVRATPADYQQALLQIIEEAENDPRQLRNVVYELARTNLKKEIELDHASVTPDDVGALETAISRIEIDASRWERSSSSPAGAKQGRLRRHLPGFLTRLTNGDPVDEAGEDETTSEHASHEGSWPATRRFRAGGSGAVAPSASGRDGSVEIVYPERPDAERMRRRVWLWFIVWPFIQLAGPIIFCLFLYFIIAGRVDLQPTTARRPADQSAVETPQSSGLPLPSTYGIFAVSSGTLHELQALPIRAPDPRIQLSAEITKPSTTVLPDGRLAFILFERDLVNRAPEKLTVRVVARVMNNVTFSSGKAAAVKPEASWHIRGGNPFTFQVSPLNESREMVAARPEDPELVLPSGRYALVLGGVAYDFTVDGPVTDITQCLESFEAVGGAVFTDCKPK